MITDDQIRIVRALRDGLPLSAEPFGEIAEKAEVSEQELLEQLRAWKDNGTIRRFGAILRHHRAGFTVNAMAVWNVQDERIEEFGRVASSPCCVSHCYERERFPTFRFNIYTMIHGESAAEVEATAKEISDKTGVTDYQLLYTTTEFKKSNPVYFP